MFKKILGVSSLCVGLLVGTTSCGENSLFNKGKIAWDYVNAPERIGLDKREYETGFYQLERKAFLSERPWSGHYWPDYQGGISYRWNAPSSSDRARVFYRTKKASKLGKDEIQYLSPAEKYDLLLGDDSYSTTRYERRRTGVFSDPNIPEWFGLCHAWAPATLFYKSPNPITVKRRDGLEIPFGASDIRALLIYFLNDKSINSRTYFVSRRCNVDERELRKQMKTGTISPSEYRRQMESADCIGVNPGSFHIILANMIGKKDQGFVMDMTRDAEVWNQAVHGYKSRILDKRRHSFSPGADPKTVTEVRVATRTYYISEITPSWERDSGENPTEIAYHEYWLELDKNNEIIGGTWISDARPDFLWKMVKPKFPSRYKVLEELYELSTEARNRRVRLASLK